MGIFDAIIKGVGSRILGEGGQGGILEQGLDLLKKGLLAANPNPWKTCAGGMLSFEGWVSVSDFPINDGEQVLPFEFPAMEGGVLPFGKKGVFIHRPFDPGVEHNDICGFAGLDFPIRKAEKFCRIDREFPEKLMQGKHTLVNQTKGEGQGCFKPGYAKGGNIELHVLRCVLVGGMVRGDHIDRVVPEPFRDCLHVIP